MKSNLLCVVALDFNLNSMDWVMRLNALWSLNGARRGERLAQRDKAKTESPSHDITSNIIHQSMHTPSAWPKWSPHSVPRECGLGECLHLNEILCLAICIRILSNLVFCPTTPFIRWGAIWSRV